MARAIAICKDGPLDGVIVSVELGDDGAPPPLTSRAEVYGALYVPSEEVLVDVEHGEQFGELEHERSFEYVVDPSWVPPDPEVTDVG